MKNNIGVQDKIFNSKNYPDLQKELGIMSQSEFLFFLFNYIKWVIQCNTLAKQKSVVKALKYIEIISDELDGKDTFEVLARMKKIKMQAVEKIKGTPKNQRQNNKNIKILRYIANTLESIEVAFDYEIKPELIYANSNIVKYILFKEKNISISEDLIKKHPYLINLCNINNENILDLVIDKYLKALESYIHSSDNRRNVQYYDEILSLMLITPKISIDSKVIERNILKIKQYQNTNIGCTNALIWLNHLYNRLDNPKDYVPGGKDYNFLYGIEDFKQKFLNYCHDIKPVTLGTKANRMLITIDDSDVAARDDAFSVEIKPNGNYLLGLHFADVNYYCNIYPELRKIAHDRGESIYLSDKIISMLPLDFAARVLSLDEKKLSLVRSVYVEFDSYGNEISFEMKKELINVNHNFSFQDATQIMTHNSSIKEIDEMFEKLLIVSPMLKKILFDKTSSAKQAEELTEILMIYPSYRIARYFKDNKYPFLYKSHILKPEMPILLKSQLANLDSQEYSKYISIINENHNLATTSYFSVDPVNHEGLKIPCYARATSSIREYAGIVVNDCIDNFYFGHPENPIEIESIRDELKLTADYLNTRTQEIDRYVKGYGRSRTR